MNNSTASVLVTGNTYPVKDSIKALGGRWDAAAKGWRVPAAQADKARSLVAGAPRSTFTRASSSRSSYARRPGRWTGCSCGSREDSAGDLIPSSRNCASCEHDA
jgi:hypothetical protein